MIEKGMTRRRFLTKAAAAAGGLAVLGLGVQCGGTSAPEVAEVAPTETPVVKDTPTPAWEAPERILFVGGAPAFSNLGVDAHLRKLAASRDPPLIIETGRAGGADGDQGNADLEYHSENNTFALDKIREGGWDVVVLQGHPSDALSEEELYDVARKLDEEIKKVGAHTVLFMLLGLTGPREGDPIGMRTQEEGCESIGAELGARIAPVGLAGERSLQENPDLGLLTERGFALTPNMHGTYLATCVFYATLFGESPVGLSYAPEGTTEEERALLQRIAWETVSEYERPAAD